MANESVAIGSDHAGFSLKGHIAIYLKGLGYEILDVGPHTGDPVDFTDYAEAVGQGIRAALCHDIYSAHQSVEHDDANVLALGAQVVGPAVVPELVKAFLEASFSGKENHRRRVDKIKAMEKRFADGLGICQSKLSPS